MQTLKRVLCALPLAAALFATPAAAATVVVDYENYTAGDTMAGLTFVSGTPYPILISPGTIETGIGGNTGNYIHLAKEAANPMPSWTNAKFGVFRYRLGADQEYHAPLTSFDIYGSDYAILYWGANKSQVITGGTWKTINVNELGTSWLQFRALGDVYVDNLNFSTSIAAVPEPATWAMMIIGFGAAGTMVRARRKLVPTVA